MARRIDLKLRERILNACVEAALKTGIPKVSLAKLSVITGVSRRMLIYHFGSVEKLISETLGGVEKRINGVLHESLVKNGQLDSRRAILSFWNQSLSLEIGRAFRAYFHLYVEAMENRGKYRQFIERSVPGWIEWLRSEFKGHQPELTESELTLILAILRGLMLDYWATRDYARTTQALQVFLAGYPFNVKKASHEPRSL